MVTMLFRPKCVFTAVIVIIYSSQMFLTNNESFCDILYFDVCYVWILLFSSTSILSEMEK